jgi:uncharacterized CHY-type Zn-finger protein
MKKCGICGNKERLLNITNYEIDLCEKCFNDKFDFFKKIYYDLDDVQTIINRNLDNFVNLKHELNSTIDEYFNDYELFDFYYGNIFSTIYNRYKDIEPIQLDETFNIVSTEYKELELVFVDKFKNLIELKMKSEDNMQETNINDFIQQAEKVKNEMLKLNEVWHSLNFDDDVEVNHANGYPFEHSYDELANDFANWYEQLKKLERVIECEMCRKELTRRDEEYGVYNHTLCLSCLLDLKEDLQNFTLNDYEKIQKIIKSNNFEKIMSLTNDMEYFIRDGNKMIFQMSYNTIYGNLIVENGKIEMDDKFSVILGTFELTDMTIDRVKGII